MKLYKVHIKTYSFGIKYYDLFVMADTEYNMLKTVHQHPSYTKDEDGISYSYGGNGYPCPVCNTKEWLE